MDGFPYVVTALFQKAVNVVFNLLPLHISQLIYFYKCCHCCLFKQWMWFSSFCHFTLSKSSGYGFPCVLIAHLIRSGWISYYVTVFSLGKVCGFSTCFHCFLSKSNGCSSLCVITTLLIRMGWISICFHYCFAKYCVWFSMQGFPRVGCVCVCVCVCMCACVCGGGVPLFIL